MSAFRLWIRWAEDDANEGPTQLYARQALDQDEVWVGWARVPRRDAFDDREDAKRAIARHHGPKKEREVAQEAGSALRFFGMPPGALVVVPTSDDEMAIVKVARGEARRRNAEGVWSRPVTVLRDGIPRADASRRVRRLVSVPHTCLDISKAEAHVRALL